MENCAFIDIFTTQNDLFGKNNCPIQFCCEIFTNEEIHDKDKFFKPERRKLFNIIPDEDISIPGYLNSGYKTEDINTSDFNGIELKDGLRNIHKLLTSFKEKGFYIVGYNHIAYDLDILNKNMKRVLDLEPVVFDNDRMIDIMKLAECKIPITYIGSYAMDSVFTYITKDDKKIQNLRMRKSTVTDIMITKVIMTSLIDKNSSFSDIVKEMNKEREVDIMSFGKYKGAKLKYVFENDIQYCGWLMKNKDISNSRPNLIKSIKNMYNTMQ